MSAQALAECPRDEEHERTDQKQGQAYLPATVPVVGGHLRIMALGGVGWHVFLIDMHGQDAGYRSGAGCGLNAVHGEQPGDYRA